MSYSGHEVDKPFGIALGHAPGTVHNINARNAAVTAAEDLWIAGGNWTPPTTARIHQLASTVDTDGKTAAPNSVGARTVEVKGLKTWSTEESSETVILDGTTNVATANAYVMINSMRVLTRGTTSSNVGVITATADTDNSVTAHIAVNAGHSQQAFFGAPSGCTVYMGRLYGNMLKATGANVSVLAELLVNPEPDTQVAFFNVRHTFSLISDGTSALTINYWTPKKFTGPVMIKLRVTPSGGTQDVSGGFDVIVRTTGV